jgi:cytoskeletal protein CcmA (bactofilin family)
MPFIHPRRDDPTASAEPGDLLLGAGAEFEGRLTFRGTVRIDARLKGAIETDGVLIVGEHARIDADITCGTVVVHGVVNGNIRATSAIELRRTARVHGDVDSPSLSAEQGALLHGGVRMTAQERAAAHPEPPPARLPALEAAAPLAS